MARLTKAKRASKARKAAVNRRVTSALKGWLRKHNPGIGKATHLRIRKTKNGFSVAGIKKAVLGRSK